MPDSKYSRTSISSPSGSARPPPPLPPTPPPFSSPYNLTSIKTSTSQSSVYNQTSVGTTYPLPPLMPSLAFNRPGSIPMNLYGSSPNQQLGENPQSILQSLNIPQSSIPSIHSIAQLQPLQPPQLTRLPHPPQHPRPPIQASQQLEQGVSMQNQTQMQVHPLQMLQQSQISSFNNYYQSQQEFSQAQQQQQLEHAQQHALYQQGDVGIQQQQDPGMSLHEYFKSPEAIQVFFVCNLCQNSKYVISVNFLIIVNLHSWQSLLSDRDKLCQLLEQHPKLMQMLQVINILLFQRFT